MKHDFLLVLLGLGALTPGFSRSAPFAIHPVPDERFGVMTHFAHGWDVSWIPAAAGASITQVRDDLYWAAIEREPGVFSFPAEYESYMSALKASHLSPLVVLAFENPLYDGGDTPHSDEAVAAFARYAVEVVCHYGPQLKAVEIWNEFNGSFAHGPATDDRPAAYLKLLQATHTALKRERPDLFVVGGATSGVPLPYWKRLIDGGVLDHLDAVSVHPYRYDQAPEGIEQQIGDLRTLIDAKAGNSSTPVWATEIGWFTKASDADGDLAIDDDTQARFLVRAYALLLSAQVQRVYWYLLHDYQGLDMGLFQDGNGKGPAKPAARAYATLVDQLRGARFVRREPSRPDFYALTFAAAGEEVHVVWSLSPAQITTREVNSAVDVQGRAVPLSPQLSIGESPVFLRGVIADLPAATVQSQLITDASRDFSSAQGKNGWTYGALPQGQSALQLLPAYSSNDWTSGWSGSYPFLSITAGDQHPSAEGPTPVSAVRRWLSDQDGRLRIAGSFRCGTSGDGVGVSILVDGQPRFRRLLGGDHASSILEKFDFVETVHRGTIIDFAVDPGPGINLDYDATAVAVTITKESP